MLSRHHASASARKILTVLLLKMRSRGYQVLKHPPVIGACTRWVLLAQMIIMFILPAVCRDAAAINLRKTEPFPESTWAARTNASASSAFFDKFRSKRKSICTGEETHQVFAHFLSLWRTLFNLNDGSS